MEKKELEGRFPRLHVGIQANTICCDSGRKIATTVGANKKEYAMLFAAAPELLEALEDLMAFTIKHIHVADCQEYNHAARIINKALNHPTK